MTPWQRDVRDFHYLTGSHIRRYPGHVPEDVRRLRANLITEEYEETIRAMAEGDLFGVADGIVDLIYVLLGTAVSYGIDLEPVWAEVQRANMDKTRGPKRDDGKQLKPADWVPPDIEGVIQDQIDAEAEKAFTRPLRV